jgi:hypothetical protein
VTADGAAGVKVTPESDIAEKLRKLAKLHDDGLLSEEDFRSLKARLLSDEFDARHRQIATKTRASLKPHSRRKRRTNTFLIGLHGVLRSFH